MANIYVASSWRNPYYPEVVKQLRAEGHEVFDFRNPPHGGSGFRWTDIDENAQNWSFEEYFEGFTIRRQKGSLQPIGRLWNGRTPAFWFCLVEGAPTQSPVG